MALTTLKQIHEYIETHDLVIPSPVLHLFNQFLTHQMLSLSNACIDTKKVRTEFIVKANKLLQQEWGEHYHRLFELIQNANPYPHGFFNREIVKFYLIMAYYYYVQNDYKRTQVVLLSFAKYMFSVHFKVFFPNGCNEEVMQAALHYVPNQSLIKKFELNYHQVCQYIVKHSFTSFTETLGRKNHPDIIYQIMRNISTRLKQVLKPLSKAYYEAYKKYKETGAGYETGTQITKQDLLQQMKLHIEEAIEALPKSVFEKLKLIEQEGKIKSTLKLHSNLIMGIVSELMVQSLQIKKLLVDGETCKRLKVLKNALFYNISKCKSYIELVNQVKDDIPELIQPQANLKHIVSYAITLCWNIVVCSS